MVGVLWLELPDSVSFGKMPNTGVFPVLNDDDECVGVVFTGLPPNITFRGHLDVDELPIDAPYFVRLNTDEKGVAHFFSFEQKK